MNPLRAIIRQTEERWFEALLLELDIAVAATSVEDVVVQIERALILEYQVARELGQTPFACAVRSVPQELERYLWTSKGNKQYPLDLPDEVVDALAIALHSLAPAKQPPAIAVTRYALAA